LPTIEEIEKELAITMNKNISSDSE
jgi:hypothetical protein